MQKLSNLSSESLRLLLQAIKQPARYPQAARLANELLLAEQGEPFPNRHLCDLDGNPVPFHRAQEIAFDSRRRTIAMIAGTQSGKTTFGPWWLRKEIAECGSGDYFAVTSTYDLFKLKMLPEFLRVFEEKLQLGRFWNGPKIFELKDPRTGKYWATRSNDRMYARVILRSASTLAGLESATVKAMWLDECGQDQFSIQARRALKRRGSLFRAHELMTTTLYNLGWIKQEVIDAAERGGVKTIERGLNGGEVEVTDNPAENVCLIQYDSIINPLFPMEEYEHARRVMPEEDFLMFYRGRVANLRYLIYDVFDRKRHTCARFPIPPHWKRFMGLDFGGVNTAALFFAEEKICTEKCQRDEHGKCRRHDPSLDRLYCYREYHAGGKSAKEHAHDLLEGEAMRPNAYGGAGSEGQWRREFAAGGLPIKQPTIGDVEVGIARFYAQLKQDRLFFFDDLHGVLDELGRYRRERDKAGNITEKIENKNEFHFLDSGRYVISSIRGSTDKTSVDFA